MIIRHLASSAFVILLAGSPLVLHAATYDPSELTGGGGVPPAGYPSFQQWQDVKITLTRNGSGPSRTYTLSADFIPVGTSNYNSFRLNPSSSYAITNSTVNLTANFNAPVGNALPVFTSGQLSIQGDIPSWDVPGIAAPTNTNLYTADLSGYYVDPVGTGGSKGSLGFSTTNAGGWASAFQTVPTESVYLYDFNVPGLISTFYSSKIKTATWAQATQVTTVPIPAALWLFGSALGIISGFRRLDKASKV